MCHTPFLVAKTKGQGHTSRFFYRIRFVDPYLFTRIFIIGPNTTHGSTVCCSPFPGQKIKGQGHNGQSKSLPCLLRGSLSI